MGFILASASPRRKELLELAGLEFSVKISTVDETLLDGLSPQEQVKRLALQKAADVAALYPGETIIGSDTIVVYQNEILGKPENRLDAFQMLEKLNGQQHEVMTAVALINQKKGIEDVFVNVTTVDFYQLGKEWLNDYIESGEPMDKAGAYGIQGKGFELVEKINGDFYSVMGLPISQLKQKLRGFSLLQTGRDGDNLN